MNNSKTATQKHMTLDDRISIEKGLDQHLSLRSIALQLGKDPTTISKEIKKHRSFQEHNRFNEPANKCALAKDCKKKNICGTYAPVCKRMCRSCNHCNSHCEDFIPRSYHCSLLDKAPFVCNGCSKKNPCRLDKAYYRSSTAHRQYKTILVESRAGINISPADLVALDELVKGMSCIKPEKVDCYIQLARMYCRFRKITCLYLIYIHKMHRFVPLMKMWKL